MVSKKSGHLYEKRLIVKVIQVRGPGSEGAALGTAPRALQAHKGGGGERRRRRRHGAAWAHGAAGVHN